ncbi:hypothetical protein [Burkholderia cenocepacia]|uniref:Phage protein n=1 Tax=Burkholderia cenocepacia TaxID=95486 RepID=A0ABD4UCH5_9BURK|nr:hypothetical protein [Burkholderia cenocepacia]MCW3696343.1 hypothetical protein [Burkholderia cenocepacia]MCW3704438.1 hypothetical protein [Burkholderia cenocepacia]MCW3712123.1 hypothetical protein [Burkholderia cenocepacia]MCW3720122.1 hypothetical protein [Burkholderia cenocepacia]MCW3727814.1 hypothetical protein [Burkholderia cenocepacia]
MFYSMMFNIDGGKEYRGISDGKTWNGWAMPFFTFEVACQFMEDHNKVAVHEKLVYDAASDSFLYETEDYPDDPERFEATVIDGVKYYGVGAGSWVWDGERIDA